MLCNSRTLVQSVFANPSCRHDAEHQRKRAEDAPLIPDFCHPSEHSASGHGVLRFPPALRDGAFNRRAQDGTAAAHSKDSLHGRKTVTSSVLAFQRKQQAAGRLQTASTDTSMWAS